LSYYFYSGPFYLYFGQATNFLLFLHLILGTLLFFLLISLKKINFQKAFQVFSISISIQSLLAIFQFFTQQSFSNKYLGVSSQSAWQGGAHVLENSLGRWLRGYGGLPHPNILGGFLVISLIFGIYYYLTLQKKEKTQRYISLIILSVNFLALLITFSRSAWMGFLVAIAIIIFLLRKKINKKLLQKTLSLFVVLAAIFSIFLFSYYELIFPRLAPENRLESKSINERSVLLEESKSIIKNNFFLGVGAGNYTNYLQQKSSEKKPVWKNQPVHNVFLLIFAELGIVGFLLFLGILIFTFLEKIYFSYQKLTPLNIFVLSSIFALIVISLFDHWLWTNVSGLILLWLILGFYKKS